MLRVSMSGHRQRLSSQCICTHDALCCSVPLNHAKLSAGGAASELQVSVTESPSDASAAGTTEMEVERGPSWTGERNFQNIDFK